MQSVAVLASALGLLTLVFRADADDVAVFTADDIADQTIITGNVATQTCLFGKRLFLITRALKLDIKDPSG